MKCFLNTFSDETVESLWAEYIDWENYITAVSDQRPTLVTTLKCSSINTSVTLRNITFKIFLRHWDLHMGLSPDNMLERCFRMLCVGFDGYCVPA